MYKTLYIYIYFVKKMKRKIIKDVHLGQRVNPNEPAGKLAANFDKINDRTKKLNKL